jgi:hypothetical protein
LVETTYPEQNLWVSLTPSLVPAGMLALAVLIMMYRTRKRIRSVKKTGTTPPDQVDAKIEGLVAVLPMVVFPVLANIPAAAIPWHPSPGMVMWAGFSPWIAVSVFLLVVSRINRNRSATIAWFRARSLQRPIQLEVTAEAVETDNGLMKCRWRWTGFIRYRETKNLIILVTEDQTQLAIPKRAVAETATLDALYALIQNSIDSGDFLPRESRFPVLPTAVIAT